MATTHAGFSSPVSAVEFDLHVENPIQHLLICHKKLQRSLSIVKNAAEALELTEPVLRAEAVAALDYELALLQLLDDLHTQDEEQSLLPKLYANRPDSGVVGQLSQNLESNRAQKAEIFGQLAACLRDVSKRRGELAKEHVDRLENLVDQLARLYTLHLTEQSDHLIELCRQYLSDEDTKGMRAVMRARYQS